MNRFKRKLHIFRNAITARLGQVQFYWEQNSFCNYEILTQSNKENFFSQSGPKFWSPRHYLISKNIKILFESGTLSGKNQPNFVSQNLKLHNQHCHNPLAIDPRSHRSPVAVSAKNCRASLKLLKSKSHPAPVTQLFKIYHSFLAGISHSRFIT